jgi:hypothetical protein
MFKTYKDEDYKMIVDGVEYISTPELDMFAPMMISALFVFASLFVTAINLF